MFTYSSDTEKNITLSVIRFSAILWIKSGFNNLVRQCVIKGNHLRQTDSQMQG